MKISDEEYLKLLYKKLLHREPDLDGFKSHLKELKNGVDRSIVFLRIAESNERKEIELDKANVNTQRGISSFVSSDDAFGYNQILKLSRKYFNNSEFFVKLAEKENIFRNKKSEVNCIAVYYWKISTLGLGFCSAVSQSPGVSKCSMARGD